MLAPSAIPKAVFSIGVVLAVFTAPARCTAQNGALANSASPYLRMHAQDAIRWQRWGEEIIAEAHRTNKPIFLSIGFYTCHWCQVMERESFHDPVVSHVLNKYFLPVVVDREEEPDVDEYFSNIVEQQFGNSGWPLNLVLTPDLQPVWNRMYLPAHPRNGLPGLAETLDELGQHWQSTRTATSTDTHERSTGDDPRHVLDIAWSAVAQSAYQRITDAYDSEYGGFGSPPKFIRPTVLRFLLVYSKHTHNTWASRMARFTLSQVRKSAIRDQIGGGFFRVAMQQDWTRPHFEKTLYDQALMADVYLMDSGLGGCRSDAQIVRNTLDFTLREIRAESRGFYSSLGAESLNASGELQDGAYYQWSPEELISATGSKIASYRYGLDHNPGVPFIAHSAAQAAKAFHVPQDAMNQSLMRMGYKLLAARNSRSSPLIDTKIITAWNGLVVSSLARAGKTLNGASYLRDAEETCALFLDAFERHGFLGRELVGRDFQLGAYLDDYAFFIRALLDLYDSTNKLRYLRAALRLQALQQKLFWDESGTYRFSPPGAAPWLQRYRLVDQDEPSPIAVSVSNLMRLARATGNASYSARSKEVLHHAKAALRDSPESIASLLTVAMEENTF